MNPQQLKIDHTADGVVLAAVRRVCADTRMLPGAAIGELCGSDKATAEANAAVEFGPSFREAGAAARAAAAIAP